VPITQVQHLPFSVSLQGSFLTSNWQLFRLSPAVSVVHFKVAAAHVIVASTPSFQGTVFNHQGTCSSHASTRQLFQQKTLAATAPALPFWPFVEQMCILQAPFAPFPCGEVLGALHASSVGLRCGVSPHSDQNHGWVSCYNATLPRHAWGPPQGWGCSRLAPVGSRTSWQVCYRPCWSLFLALDRHGLLHPILKTRHRTQALASKLGNRGGQGWLQGSYFFSYLEATKPKRQLFVKREVLCDSAERWIVGRCQGLAIVFWYQSQLNLRLNLSRLSHLLDGPFEAEYC